MKAGLGTVVNLLGRLMRVDWSATTENMPACDTSQPLSRCIDFTTWSACDDAFDMGEPTRDDFSSCSWNTFHDENYQPIITPDGEEVGVCYVTPENYDSPHARCQSDCSNLIFDYGRFNRTGAIECYAACDADYTLCTHKKPTHAEVIARDVSDGINHEVLANVRDFLNQIVSALPDTETRPPVCLYATSRGLAT